MSFFIEETQEESVPTMESPVDSVEKGSISSSVRSFRRNKLIQKVPGSSEENGSEHTPYPLQARFRNAKSLKEFYKKRKERQMRHAHSAGRTEIQSNRADCSKVDDPWESMKENNPHRMPGSESFHGTYDKNAACDQVYETSPFLEMEKDSHRSTTQILNQRTRNCGTAGNPGERSEFMNKGMHSSRRERENPKSGQRGNPRAYSSYECTWRRNSFVSDNFESRDGCTADDFAGGLFLCGLCSPICTGRKGTPSYDDIRRTGSVTAEKALQSVKYLSEKSNALHQTLSLTLTPETLDRYLDCIEQHFHMTHINKTESFPDMELATGQSDESFVTGQNAVKFSTDSLETERTRPVNNNTSSSNSFEIQMHELIVLMQGQVSSPARKS